MLRQTHWNTNPVNEDDLAEDLYPHKSVADINNSWTVNVMDIDQSTFDLNVNSPNKNAEVPHSQPQEILVKTQKPDSEAKNVRTLIGRILGLLADS